MSDPDQSERDAAIARHPVLESMRKYRIQIFRDAVAACDAAAKTPKAPSAPSAPKSKPAELTPAQAIALATKMVAESRAVRGADAERRQANAEGQDRLDRAFGLGAYDTHAKPGVVDTGSTLQFGVRGDRATTAAALAASVPANPEMDRAMGLTESKGVESLGAVQRFGTPVRKI